MEMITPPPPDPEMTRLTRSKLDFRTGLPDRGVRLDEFTAGHTGLSPGRAAELIEFGAVWVGGKVSLRPDRRLETGERIQVYPPYYGPVRFYEPDPARIIYRDKWLLAYDKEAGAPCQQTPYDAYNNLYAGLRRLDPGYLALHHRLDGPTSGVMLFGRRPEINKKLAGLFAAGEIVKTYLAEVKGRPEKMNFVVDRPIAKRKGSYFCPEDGRGKPARTEFEVLEIREKTTLVRARPLTGRTHQIRLHLQAVGLPIVGDAAHQGPPGPRLMLHALSLVFRHPAQGRELEIEAAPPESFRVRESEAS